MEKTKVDKIIRERDDYKFLLGYMDRYLDNGNTLFKDSPIHKLIKETVVK